MPQEYRPVLVKGFSLREFSDVPYYIENFKVDENGRLVATKGDLIDSAVNYTSYAYGMWGIINAFYGYDANSPNYRKIVLDAIGVRLQYDNQQGKYEWIYSDPHTAKGDRVLYKITELKETTSTDNVTVTLDNMQAYESDLNLFEEGGYINFPSVKLYGEILVEPTTGKVYYYDIATGNKTEIYSGTPRGTSVGVFVYRNDSINKNLILNSDCQSPDPNCNVKYDFVIVDVWDYVDGGLDNPSSVYLDIYAHRYGTPIDSFDTFSATLSKVRLSFKRLIGFSLKGDGYILAFESYYIGALIYDSTSDSIIVVNDTLGSYFPYPHYKYIEFIAYREVFDQLIIGGTVRDTYTYTNYLFVYLKEGTSEKVRKVEYTSFNEEAKLSPIFKDLYNIEIMVYQPLSAPPEAYWKRDDSFLFYFYDVTTYDFFNQYNDDSQYFTRRPQSPDYYALANYDTSKYTEPPNLTANLIDGNESRFIEYTQIKSEHFYFKFFDYYVGKYGIMRKNNGVYDYVVTVDFNFNDPKILNISGKYYVVDGDTTFVFTPHYFYKLNSHPYFNTSGTEPIYTRLWVYVNYSDGYEAKEIFPYYKQYVDLNAVPQTTYKNDYVYFYFIDIPSNIDAQLDIVMYVSDDDPATPDYWGRFVNPTTGKGAGTYKIDTTNKNLVIDSVIALSFLGVKTNCTDQVDTYGVLPPMEYKQINEHSIFFQNRILVPQKNKIYYSDVNNPHCFNSTYLYLGFNEQSDIVTLYGKANTLLIGFENGAVYVARGILPNWYVDSDGLVRMPEFQIKKLPFYFPNLKMLLIHANVYYAICDDKIYAFDDDGYKMLFDLTPKLPVEVKSDGTWTLSLEPLGGKIFEVSEEYENAVYIPITRNINGIKNVGFIKFAPHTNALYLITSDLDYDSSKSHILYYAFDPYNRCVVVNNGDYMAFLSKGNGNKDNIVSIYLPPFYSLFLQRVLFDGKAITGKSSINLMVSNDPSNPFNFKSYSYPNVSMEEFRKIIKTNLKGKYIGVTLKNLEYLNSISLIWNSVAKRNETTQ